MTGFHELAPAAIASGFGFGMVLAILASLKKSLSEKMEVPEGRVGRWISAGHLAVIPFTFFSGILVDQWGIRGTLDAGSLLAGLGLFTLTLGGRPWTTWIGLAAAAAGASALSVGAIVLMPRAFFGNNAASANLGLVFFPLGGLVTGGLAPFIFQKLEIRRALSLSAGICLIPAFVVALTPTEAFTTFQNPGEPGSVWSSPVIWLICLGFLLYTTLEGSLGSWTSTYLSQLGFSKRRADLLMGIFWLTFVASRLGAAFFEYHYVHEGEPWVVITLACLTAVGVGGLAGTRECRHAILWLLLIAMALAPIFPNLVGVLYHQFGEGEIGTAYGAMVLVGGAVSLVFPPIMSAYAGRKSLRVALRLPTVISILLAAGTLALALSR